MDFRFPHPAENIGAAVRDAVNPETSEDGSLVIQLMNENNRAVEDAFQDSGSSTPPPGGDGFFEDTFSFTVAEASSESASFTLPAAGVWAIEAVAAITLTPSGGDGSAAWYLVVGAGAGRDPLNRGCTLLAGFSLYDGAQYTTIWDTATDGTGFGPTVYLGSSTVTSADVTGEVRATWLRAS